MYTITFHYKCYSLIYFNICGVILFCGSVTRWVNHCYPSVSLLSHKVFYQLFALPSVCLNHVFLPGILPLGYWSIDQMAVMCTREFLKTTSGKWVLQCISIKDQLISIFSRRLFEEASLLKANFVGWCVGYCRMLPQKTSWQCWRVMPQKSKVALEKCWRGKWLKKTGSNERVAKQQ